MEDQEKYERALKRVKEIRSFYSHLFIYLTINILLQLFYRGMFDGGEYTSYIPWWSRLGTPVIWGLCVLIHGFVVYSSFSFSERYKKWEEKKIKAIMQKEEAQSDKTY